MFKKDIKMAGGYYFQHSEDNKYIGDGALSDIIRLEGKKRDAGRFDIVGIDDDVINGTSFSLEDIPAKFKDKLTQVKIKKMGHAHDGLEMLYSDDDGRISLDYPRSDTDEDLWERQLWSVKKRENEEGVVEVCFYSLNAAFGETHQHNYLGAKVSPRSSRGSKYLFAGEEKVWWKISE